MKSFVFIGRNNVSYRAVFVATALIFYVHIYLGFEQSQIPVEYNVTFSPSIFVAVLRTDSQNTNVVKYMSESWLAKMDLHMVFSSFQKSEDSVYFHGNNAAGDYAYLIRWLCQWIVSLKSLHKFDYFLLVTDKTFIIPNNLRATLSELEVDKASMLFSVLDGCAKQDVFPDIILNMGAVRHLAKSTGDNLIKNESNSSRLCSVFEDMGLQSFNLSTDVDGKNRFMYIDRHFSRQEMDDAIKSKKEYVDGKEVFEKLSPDMITFSNVNPLEHSILNSYLYRLNKQQV